MADAENPTATNQERETDFNCNPLLEEQYTDGQADAYNALSHQQSAQPTNVLIVRHGNTFDKGDTVTRVGKHTDLPLSSSGIAQAENLGQYLATHHPDLAAVFTSSLVRTRETAQIALSIAGLNPTVTASGDFDEIDYGPDENKPEAEVIARVGEAAIKTWELDGIPPPDWKVNPEALKQTWRDFFQMVRLDYAGKTVMVVTSNGIARFAPYCLKAFDSWRQSNGFKMRTGAISLFSYQAEEWSCGYWNETPRIEGKTA